jgi:hypothetical protein
VYGFVDPPNDTDKKVISALKTHWSTMVIRVSLHISPRCSIMMLMNAPMQILRDPERSLGVEEPYSYERVTPAQMFGRTALIDPSFKRSVTVSFIDPCGDAEERPAF